MLLISSFLLVFGIININCEHLPPDISKCRSEDHQCIKKTANDLIQKYPNGRKDLNIPQMDPFIIKKTELEIPSGQSLDFHIKLNDVVVRGMSKMTVDKVIGFTKDPLTSKFELYGTIPKFEFSGNYSANLRLLVLPFQGYGKFKITLKNCRLSFRFKPKVYKKADGLTYLKLDKIKIHLEPESMKTHLTNSLTNREELNEAINDFINENWRELWNEFSPITYKIAEQGIKDIASGIFDRFNYDGIYLD